MAAHQITSGRPPNLYDLVLIGMCLQIATSQRRQRQAQDHRSRRGRVLIVLGHPSQGHRLLRASARGVGYNIHTHSVGEPWTVNSRAGLHEELDLCLTTARTSLS